LVIAENKFDNILDFELQKTTITVQTLKSLLRNFKKRNKKVYGYCRGMSRTNKCLIGGEQKLEMEVESLQFEEKAFLIPKEGITQDKLLIQVTKMHFIIDCLLLRTPSSSSVSVLRRSTPST
jgi:hypothetical protein